MEEVNNFAYKAHKYNSRNKLFYQQEKSYYQSTSNLLLSSYFCLVLIFKGLHPPRRSHVLYDFNSKPPTPKLPHHKPRPHSILLRHRLNIPNRIRILLDTSIAAEKSHPAHARDTFADPLVLILVRLVHERMRRDIRVEIVRDKIIVAMVDDGAAQGAEPVGIAKRVRFDGVEDFGEVGVERKGAEVVGVA